MVFQRDLNPPPDVAAAAEKEAARVESFLTGHRLRLSDEKAEKIEKDLAKKYEAWKNSTNTLRRRLIRYNDLMEGVVQETNFPFEGASNITIHYAAGISRTFRSTFNKTMYQDENLAIPSLDPTLEMPEDRYKALQDGFNHTLSTTYNALDILKDATIPAIRDGTVIISGSWERRVQKAHDTRTYSKPSEFVKDYPDAASAGVEPPEYQDILSQWVLEPDAQLQVGFDYDFVEFDGIEYKINSLAKFVFYPTFATKISRMELYGSEYTASEQEIETGKKRRLYYERALEKLEERKRGTDWNDWDRSRTSIEGINSASDEYRPIRLLDFVYTKDLDGDGIPEKYIGTYAVEAKALLTISKYSIRNNIDLAVAFRLIARENRFLGVSLVGDCEDIFNQLDVIHRHRNNVRMLCTSPVFVAKTDYKELIDMGRAENVIRPGLTLWVADINSAIKQLPIENLDQPGNSLDEENLLVRYVELVFGPTQGLSGNQTPQDPRAPARKTQMLLMQANQRIDDYMDEFRKSMPDLFRLHAALLFQYYPQREITFDKDNKVFKFPLDLLANQKITWEPSRRSINLTPEFAMNRMVSLMAIWTQLLPLIMRGDAMAIEMWNRQVKNSGEPDSDRLVLDERKIQMITQQAQMLEQQTNENEMNRKAKTKAKETLSKEVAKHVGARIGQVVNPKPQTENGASAALAPLGGM